MSEPMLSPSRLFQALAAEMATAVAALLGETTATTRVAPPADTAWLARITASGPLNGTISIGLTEADGRRVSALIMGLDGDDVLDEAVVDTLREICGQAIGAVGQAPETASVTLVIDSVSRDATAVGADDAWQFPLPGGATPALAVGGALVIGAAVAAAPAPAALPAAPASTPGSNLDLLLDVELPLAVRFGQAELTLHHLTRLGPGSVIDLRRSADEPVEVLVGGKVIARGEVVVVEGNYGVRVTEVVSTADRIRSLGA